MRETTKKILFIASLALNVVFVATYIAYKLPSLTGQHQPAAPSGPLFHQLDLTPDQLARFKAERESFHGRLEELGQEIKTKQIELIDLLGSTPPDQQAIEARQQEIEQLQREVQDRVIVHFLQASAFLTPDQRARFFELIKGRIGTSVQACPPWMRPLEQGRPGASKNE